MTSIQQQLPDAIRRCPICGSTKTKMVASNVEENLGLLGESYEYRRCRACNVVSQQPPPQGDLLSSYYQLIDNKQRAWSSSAQGQALLSKIQARMQHRDSLPLRLIRFLATGGEQLYPYWRHLKPGSIVDLGAGSGGFCLEAGQRGWSVSGIEQSQASVQLARQMGLQLIHADLASPHSCQLIEAASNVVMNHVFEHISDPICFLQTLMSSMTPGSRLVLLIPNPNSIWRILFGQHWYGWDPPVHVHHYSTRALRKILVSVGFSILELHSIRRSDSLAVALNQIGIRPGRLRFVLRALMVPIMPLLAWAGLGPELICVAEVAPARPGLSIPEAS